MHVRNVKNLQVVQNTGFLFFSVFIKQCVLLKWNYVNVILLPFNYLKINKILSILKFLSRLLFATSQSAIACTCFALTSVKPLRSHNRSLTEYSYLYSYTVNAILKDAFPITLPSFPTVHYCRYHTSWLNHNISVYIIGIALSGCGQLLLCLLVTRNVALHSVFLFLSFAVCLRNSSKTFHPFRGRILLVWPSQVRLRCFWLKHHLCMLSMSHVWLKCP